MSNSEAIVRSKNPFTQEIVWEGPSASEEEVNRAVASARQASKQWSRLPMQERERVLLQFQKVLEQKRSFFAEAISKEMGKPLWESQAEVDSMLAKVSIAIESQQTRCQQMKKTLPQGTSLTRHKPLGVVVVPGPYNFPGHLPNGHIVPALLAGNTVVFKPSERTPAVGIMLCELWKEAGLPEGVLNLVQGGQSIGKMLANHADINGLFFTGSWNIGKLLAQEFGKRPDRLLALEMGGNNPLVVGEISDLQAAAYLIIQSAFITSGQRCTCARRLILQEGKKSDALLETLVEMTRSLKIGGYTEQPEPFMGPVVSIHSSRNLLTVQKAFVSMGAKMLLEMQELKQDRPLLSPAILDVTASKRFDEEVFGPLLQVVRVKDFSSAIEEANRTHFGLCAGLLSDDKEQYELFYAEARAGVINWNTPTTGASSAAPFGGVGRSGNFRPSAFYAADYCNYPVASIEAASIVMPQVLPPGMVSK